MSAELDFVVYLGDPDEGAEAVESKALLAGAEKHKAKLDFPGAYGAITISEKGKEKLERKPDPILPLITKFVRTVPYLIDGETETILLTESETGFLLEPAKDDVLISCFVGDSVEPEEFLLEPVTVPLQALGEQILSMAERMRDVLKKVSPELFEGDGDGKSLEEFIDMSRTSFKTFKLEVQRGLRVT
jgi:hypothetical protein